MSDSVYVARTFDSMIDSNGPGTEHRWALLLDYNEALCYALVVAQNTGRKVRVIAEQQGWLVYVTGQGIEDSGNGKVAVQWVDPELITQE